MGPPVPQGQFHWIFPASLSSLSMTSRGLQFLKVSYFWNSPSSRGRHGASGSSRSVISEIFQPLEDVTGPPVPQGQLFLKFSSLSRTSRGLRFLKVSSFWNFPVSPGRNGTMSLLRLVLLCFFSISRISLEVYGAWRSVFLYFQFLKDVPGPPVLRCQVLSYFSSDVSRSPVPIP